MTLNKIVAPSASGVLPIARALIDAIGRSVRVVEIGTSYGDNLPSNMSSAFISHFTAIDPMYDWVPDLPPTEKFDSSLVDAEKLRRWHENAKKLYSSTIVNLIIGSSYYVCLDATRYGSMLELTDVLIVDGCHHPTEAVESDYRNMEWALADEHFVLFDDLSHNDPQIAFNNIVADLTSRQDYVVETIIIADVGILHVKRTSSQQITVV